jgi:TPR repeat protein
MALRAWAGSMTVAVAVTTAAIRLSAQAPHEISVYALVDGGPVHVPGGCSCIASPFTVMYPPSRGPMSGPGSPLAGTPPPINMKHVADDRASIGTRSADGFDGNGNASISIATHLAVESALAGTNLRTEEEAARWLYLAASQEHPDAFRLLGFRYTHGRGVAQDDAAAAHWFRQGALRGDVVSMTALGLRYAAGRGVTQNWRAAVTWWMRAQRAPLASRFLGDAYACGLGVDAAPELAVGAYKAAAKDGELSSSTQLGHMYARGCVRAEDAEAVKAYRAAADQGDPEAQVALSDLLRQGRGADPNPYEAYTFARLAELRLPDGDLKALAAERVKSAARLMNPEAIPGQEALVKSLIAASAPVAR